MDDQDDVKYYVIFVNTTIRTSVHEQHLRKFISNNIYNRNIK